MRGEVDVVVSGGGSVYLLHLHSQSARQWVEEHVAEERMMFGAALAVEHRFVADVVAGMMQDGLAVAHGWGWL